MVSSIQSAAGHTVTREHAQSCVICFLAQAQRVEARFCQEVGWENRGPSSRASALSVEESANHKRRPVLWFFL